jgi:hypothetical protein
LCCSVVVVGGFATRFVVRFALLVLQLRRVICCWFT